MALSPGTRLGSYEVLAKLGEGGMGEVYRARDAKLQRDVAIKVLPELVATDPDRLARFEQEARALAALNHPNIAAIYAVEPRALVMELVEGEDLSAVIARGAMPLSDALPLASQIIDALEAAHEQGIVHRDLKPANVKVRHDGTVKVLDIGLAKALTGDSATTSSNAMNSPTLTARATAAGVLLGTAAYMSPEQARGRPVDRRADIWAFGCVLFEMLAGRRPFAGDDLTETVAAVVKDEPAWSLLPANVPDPIRRLLRRCLEKDPKRRLSAIGDARFDFQDAVSAPATVAVAASPSRPARGLTWIVAVGVLLAIALTAGVTWRFTRATAPPLMRLTILPPPGHVLFRDPANIALSPDGRHIAFLTGSSRTDAELWIRSLDTLDVRKVEESRSAQLPFWSPDSTAVGFSCEGKLKTASISGGRARVLADAPEFRGGAWSSRGDIVFAPNAAGPLSRVSENGGPVTAVTTMRTADGETAHRFPTFLPDGVHFLFAALPSKAQEYAIYIGSVDTKSDEKLFMAETVPDFAGPGYLIYSRRGVLVAHAFDPASRRLSGEAIPLADAPGEMNLEFNAGRAASASRTGSLVYLAAAETKARLAWLDQTGKETDAINVPSGPYVGVSLSNDAKHAVVMQLAAPHTSLWWVDLVRGGLTPLIQATAWNANPIWSPKDDRIVYGNDLKGTVDIYSRRVGTSEDEVLHASNRLFKYPVSWSRDGGTIVFSSMDPDTSVDLWTLSVADKTAKPFVHTKAKEPYGAVSPNGQWIAYASDAAGPFDVYVQPFPQGGSPIRVTTGGSYDWGIWWKQDSRQLLMIDANRNLVLSDVTLTPTFSATPPRVVGRLRFGLTAELSVAATADLSRLLAVVPEQSDGARSITVVLNWMRALEK